MWMTIFSLESLMSEPTSNVEPRPSLTDEEILTYTQGKRRDLVDAITEKGMPEEKGDRMVLLAALGDMDRTAVAKIRIGAQERQSDDDRRAHLLITLLTERFGTTAVPPSRPEHAALAPVLDESVLPPLQVLPDELSVGVDTRGYEQFQRDVGDVE